ncbi:unnamed protein product [Lepeophtheirus salmonis]|uniref:(salmon louse) hypothetical protein n=1 Tax=Lepeophtheirus salmonis TaxID=72036 RepID=A0A7R8CVN5_LEPSM|nr:unnamed protein product [Lepeophtheirus salmonis]CAF2946398.1 unnamed protein product [Lepeophtheirus salmonis]
MEEKNSLSWVEIEGIPPNYRSHHLRFFFSDFVEGDKFTLCHFLHRKTQSEFSASNSTNCFSVSASFTSSDLRDEFRIRYHDTYWTLSHGEELLPSKCIIKIIKENQGVEKKAPGSLMPKGNVGTSTIYFKPLISSCQLPSTIITKLRLNFPTKNRKYGQVSPFHGSPTFEIDTNTREDNGLEEWDRHESLHDDVSARRVLSGDPDNVAGTKERTFEDVVEVTWDKGSSGLVFHTDASYWKEVDSDSKEADDWDVDMSRYDGCQGDKDSEDYSSMRNYYKRSKAKYRSSQDSVFESKIGVFEKHTKGFGKKMMRRQGWKDGDGLGSTKNKGIKVPINNNGQIHRFGLGYKESALLPFMKLSKRKKTNNCIISTVYDDPGLTDPVEKYDERKSR